MLRLRGSGMSRRLWSFKNKRWVKIVVLKEFGVGSSYSYTIQGWL